jgi:hypothetical protein
MLENLTRFSLVSRFRSAEAGLTLEGAKRAIALIAVGALSLRLFPLLLPGGPLGYVLNYDEGIYFSASALLTAGALPYRDIFFVHPPGMLVLLAPITLWARLGDVTAALAATRYLATFVGAANAALAGAIALRAFGPLAGVSAALLYATFPEAVREERGPFLEPALNLVCLAMGWAWLRSRSATGQTLAGLLGGLALSVKSWGMIWLIAACATSPRDRRVAGALRFLSGALVSLAVLVLPFALAAGRNFLPQVIGFHLARGPQGVAEMVGRLWDMTRRHPLTSILALLGSALVLSDLRQGDRVEHRTARFFAIVLALTVASFLGAPIYFHRYASFLAPSAAVLGGLAVSWIHQRTRVRLPVLVPAMLLLSAGLEAGFDLVTTPRFRAPQQLALSSFIRREVPRQECMYSLEPGWLLVADRLPDGREGILGAWAGFQKPEFLAALASHSSPGAIQAARARAWADTRRFLESCRYLVTGDWPLDQNVKQWLELRWIKRYPPDGRRGLSLFERRP